MQLPTPEAQQLWSLAKVRIWHAYLFALLLSLFLGQLLYLCGVHSLSTLGAISIVSTGVFWWLQISWHARLDEKLRAS